MIPSIEGLLRHGTMMVLTIGLNSKYCQVPMALPQEPDAHCSCYTVTQLRLRDADGHARYHTAEKKEEPEAT